MGIRGDHPPRLNIPQRPIVNQYREGKVKRTLLKGVKQYLKPYAYKQSELVARGLAPVLSDGVPFA